METGSVFVRAEDVVARRIENEQILVPIKRRTTDLRFVYTTNEVGARVWELMDGKRSLQQIADAISEEYGVAPEQATEDLQEFADQLLEAGCAARTAQAATQE